MNLNYTCKILGLFLTATLLITACPAKTQPAPNYPERWMYLSVPLTDEASVVKTIKALETAKKSGCTHIQLVYKRTCRLHEPGNESFIARAKRVRQAADRLGLKIILTVLPTGYAAQYPYFDGNILAGMPAKDMPFIVKEKKIIIDPSASLPVANAGFEKFEGDKIADWTHHDLPGKNSFVDTKEKHSGNASWRIENLVEMRKKDPRHGGTAILTQKIKVKPFQYYRVSYWTKGAGGMYPNGLRISSDKPFKQLIYSGIPIKRDKNREVSKWTRAEVTFNTLTSEEITVSLGSIGRKGIAWFDDFKIEPAGPVLIIRRPECPLTVMSDDGQTVYEEGRDFKPLRDPLLCATPFKGNLDTKHDVPFELTENSRIKDGQKLRASFYHTMVIGWSQQVISMQSEKVFKLLEQEIKNGLKYWKPDGLFFNYDEIRIGGWEKQPNGQNLTPGQILAKHVQKSCTIAHQLAPDAKLYTWSDMFTPYHNGRPFKQGKKVNGYYYLTNGNWDGAWEGLPKDMTIMNWYSPDDRTPKFFAELGNPQILCGYYDRKDIKGMKENILKWLDVTQGVPNVQGFMYTTWKRRWTTPLSDYFKLLDTVEEWRDNSK